MAQTTYTTMFVWTVLTFFWTFIKKERKKKDQLTSTRPVGFAAGENVRYTEPYKEFVNQVTDHGLMPAWQLITGHIKY